MLLFIPDSFKNVKKPKVLHVYVETDISVFSTKNFR